MLKPEDNVRITRVGAGTPMGELQRRYWLPCALTTDLPANDGAPIRVRLLGEDLVAFRDTNGDVALIDAYCPHRRERAGEDRRAHANGHVAGNR